MPRIIYVDPNEDTGHDSNTGLSPKHAKRTLQGALALDLKDKDSLLVRKGTRIDGPQVLTTNGVTYDVYSTGTERGAAPLFTIPKVSGIPNGTAITVQGSDNIIRGWDVKDADTGLLIDAGVKVGTAFVSYSGNRLERVRVFNFAEAFMIKGTQTTVIDSAVFHGRMMRNTAITYVGANGYTVWKSENYPQVGTQLIRCHAEDCYAFTSANDLKLDGSTVEVFGGVEDLVVSWMTTLNSGTLCEVGFTPSRHETARNITFYHCLVINPNGRALYVNDRNGMFGGDIEGLAFSKCTIKADDEKGSAFFIGAGHGNTSKKLSVRDCIVVGASQFYNAGPYTDIKSADRGGNVYLRSDGSKTIGLPLINDDVLYGPTDTLFHDVDAGDYRLVAGHPRGATLGALGSGPSVQETYSKTPLTNDAATQRGGYHSVVSWHHMIETPSIHRVMGMRCYVQALRRLYELQDDLNTWLSVEG